MTSHWMPCAPLRVKYFLGEGLSLFSPASNMILRFCGVGWSISWCSTEQFVCCPSAFFSSLLQGPTQVEGIATHAMEPGGGTCNIIITPNHFCTYLGLHLAGNSPRSAQTTGLGVQPRLSSRTTIQSLPRKPQALVLVGSGSYTQRTLKRICSGSWKRRGV